MHRGRVLSAVAVVLAVLAVGTIAGGLSPSASSDSSTSSGLGIGSGDGSGIGESDNVGIGTANASGGSLPYWVGLLPLLAVIWAATIVGLVLAVYFLWDSTLRELIRAIVATIGRVAVIVVIGIVVAALLLVLAGFIGKGGGGLMGTGSTTGSQFTGQASSTESPVLAVGMAVLAGIAMLGILLVVLLPSGDDGEPTVTGSGAGGERRTRETSRSVRADASVDDPAASNEVYRAWTTLRDRVGERNRSESPAQVRQRAIEAGLDERAVSELTDLFNAARYDERPVTDDEERRARDAIDALDGTEGHA